MCTWAYFFVLKNKSKLLSRNQNDLKKKLYFYRNKLIVSKLFNSIYTSIAKFMWFGFSCKPGVAGSISWFSQSVGTLSCSVSSETL